MAFMKKLLFAALPVCIFIACSKSDSTSYSNPNHNNPVGKARLIKFAYEGNVFGVFPIYEGLEDTPKHVFAATGITESDFVKTNAGDTIRITIPLSSEGTKPIVTAVEDNVEQKAVPQNVTVVPTQDATSKFQVVVK